MLGDVPRTDAYRRAIEAQAAGIKDRVVMDVGCGTGILSMMAARSGAKRVYAIEASALANDTRAVVVHNKLDNVVQVVQGLVEQVTLFLFIYFFHPQFLGRSSWETWST